MRRLVSVLFLFVLAIIPQACQRDEATAPHPFAPSAKLEGVFKASIAFSSDRDGSTGIYVMTPDGSGVTRLTTGSHPSWSPDGSQIAFVRLADGRQQIFVMNADGSAPTRVTNSTAGDLYPSWSPDGRKIAFMSTRDGNAEIYVMNADGSAPARLTNNPATDLGPSWSPDGRRIAFESLRDGGWEIYVMAADGSAQTRLTNNTTSDVTASWSPDGNTIAFSRDGHIWVMNADGSGATPLTNSSAIDVQPSWSPDGRQIAFRSGGHGSEDIYVMNADGSGVTQLTDGGEPSWSPKDASRAPAQVAFTTEPPAGVWANTAISPPVQVTVTDATGDRVPGGVVRLAIGTSPAPGATLSGRTEAKIVDGVATFTDLRIDQLGRGYTFFAEAGAASEASATFAVVEPATHLAFLAQPPPNVEGGVTMAPVRVAIQDSLGNTLSRASAPMTLAFAANPAGATLQGTTTVETVDGIATFSDLRVDQLGSGFTFAVTAPGRAGATSSPFAVQVTFAFVDAGNSVSCGVTTHGGGYCWGAHGFGQLGTGVEYFPAPERQTAPVPVAGGLSFATISVANGVNAHVCGVTTGGAGYCWGFGADGQRGDGKETVRALAPVAVSGGLSFTTISAGAVHSCGVTATGVGYCWGRGQDGALGTGSFVFRMFAPSTPVAGGLTFTTISAGVGGYSCGLTTSGAASCWGGNASGQLGDGTNAGRYGPAPVEGGIGFTTISAGGAHTCGVTPDGTAYCWGWNGSGQLGDGSTVDRWTPAPVSGGLTFTTIAAGVNHTCGVTTGGEAYCWGSNTDGRLGDGTTAQASMPVPVAGGLRFTTVRAGRTHSCGVTTSYEAYCWGDNVAGQLGTGTTTGSLTPARVVTGSPTVIATGVP